MIKKIFGWLGWIMLLGLIMIWGMLDYSLSPTEDISARGYIGFFALIIFGALLVWWIYLGIEKLVYKIKSIIFSRKKEKQQIKDWIWEIRQNVQEINHKTNNPVIVKIRSRNRK